MHIGRFMSAHRAAYPLLKPFLRGALPYFLFAATLVGHAISAFAEDAIPTPLQKERYASLLGHSPFAVATATGAPPAVQASFATNWYVSGVARIGEDYFVSIKSRDLSSEFSLFGAEAVDGVMLASVNWSDEVGQSTVILRKGTETARLEFNEEQMRAPPAGAAANPTPTGTATASGPRLPGVNVAAVSASAAPAGLSAAAPSHRHIMPIPTRR
jgi:hypothetical protein